MTSSKRNPIMTKMKFLLLVLLCCFLCTKCRIMIDTVCNENMKIYCPHRFFSGISQKSFILYKPKEGSKPFTLDVSLDFGDNVFCNVSKLISEGMHVTNGSIFMQVSHGFPRVLRGIARFNYIIKDSDANILDTVTTYGKELTALDDLIIFETDKPLYRPGEKLIARLIILDAFKLFNIQSFENAKCSNLEGYMRDPTNKFDKYNDETIYLSLKDSRGRTMANWNGISYQDALNIEYTLMSNCPTGHWSFVLKYKGKYLTEYFSVRQYILPRFIASISVIKTPKYYADNNNRSKEDNILEFAVCGKYTNGIPISGLVKGSVCNCGYLNCASINKNKCILFDKHLKQDCKKVIVDVGKWRYHSYISADIQIMAAFEEADTGVKINKSIYVDKFENNFAESNERHNAFQKMPSKLKLKSSLEKMKTYYLAFYNRYNKSINFLAKISSDDKEVNLPPFEASQTGYLYEVATNGTLKRLINVYLTVSTPSSESYFQVTPNTILTYEGKSCPKTYEVMLLTKGNFDGKTVTLFSQNMATVIEQKFKLEEDKCVDRDDMYGHYKCNVDGSISCLDGYYGSNCLKIKCQCEEECFCTSSMECICHENIMKLRELERYKLYEKPSLSVEADERNLFLYKIKIKIDENFGPEFKGIFYYLNDSNEFAMTPIVINNLYGCTSKVIKETSNSNYIKDDGFFLNKNTVKPGENITLNIQYKSSMPTKPNNVISSQSISSLCFIRAYDEILKNFAEKNKEFAYNLKEYLTDLKKIYLDKYLEFTGYWDTPRYANLDYMSKCHIAPLRYEKLGGSDEKSLYLNSGIKVRDYFPESWFFKAEVASVLDKENSINGLKLDLKVPDSVTQWNIAAYCPTESDGLWIPKEILKINVAQPFHIEMNLPTKATRGESFKLPVTIIFEEEYLIKENNLITISVHVDDDEWEIGNGHKHQICMLSGTRAFVELFELNPKRLGNLNLTLIATASIDNSLCSLGIRDEKDKQVLNDAIRRSINVVAEGIIKEESNTKIICLKDSKAALSKTTVMLPKENIVSGSLKTYVGATGDSMSLISDNLDKLIRKPYGCGEQNMISVVPSVTIASYLLSSEKPKDDKEHEKYNKMLEKAKGYIHDGYQRELTYRLRDGSFSAFGEQDKFGSTWLTSFVIQVFSQASKTLKEEWKVDSTKMFKEAIMYIKSVMDDRDCFSEKGKLFDRELKSISHEKSTSGINSIIQIIHSLCSVHCSPIFKDDKNMQRSLLEDISKSYKCLQNKLKSINLFNPDTLLVFTQYTRLLTQLKMLDLVDESQINNFLQKLEEKANYDTKSGMKWWGDEQLSVETNLKVTSNALLALEKTISKEQMLPIVRWILSKQKISGGFYSTQDTILAIEALSKYNMDAFRSSVVVKAEINVNKNDKSIVFTLDDNDRKAYNLRETILIGKEIPGQITFMQKLSTAAPTSGCLQLISSIVYNRKIENTAELVINAPFKTEVKVDQQINSSFKCKNPKMRICANSLENGETTGMLLMTVEIPTGFQVNKNKAEMQVSISDNGPKRIEFDDTMSAVYVYYNGFTEVDTLPRCVSLEAEQMIYVENLKSGIATTQDYYATKDIHSVNYAISSCEKYWTDEIDEINKKRDESRPNFCICNRLNELNDITILDIKKSICQKTAKYEHFTRDDMNVSEFEDKDILKKCRCVESFPVLIYQQSEKDSFEVYSDSTDIEKLMNVLLKPCLRI